MTSDVDILAADLVETVTALEHWFKRNASGARAAEGWAIVTQLMTSALQAGELTARNNQSLALLHRAVITIARDKGHNTRPLRQLNFI